MFRWIKTSLVILLVFAILPAVPVQAQTNPCVFSGVDANGALYYISLPPSLSGCVLDRDLVIFAHGYVSVNAPLDIPWSQMTFSNGMGGFITLPDVVNGLGYAFATTSYRMNGLAVQQGIEDILNLVDVFKQTVGTPNHIYLVGASEGGLVTTLAVERRPDVFSGGLATCGPIGSFQGQVNYWGDFRVVFDYMMDRPGFNLLPGSAVNVPQVMMNKWDSVYTPRIVDSLVNRPAETGQLMAVTKAPFDMADPTTVGATTLGILWYNAFATNDAVQKLGGQPFDNHDRVYSGSFNDTLLNKKVKRFSADPIALAEIASKYETSGVLFKPLVTMHTTGDPIVPIWHQYAYTAKTPGQLPVYPYMPIKINRYGHCNFTLLEMQNGFTQLVAMVMLMEQFPPTPPLMTQIMDNAGTYYYDYH